MKSNGLLCNTDDHQYVENKVGDLYIISNNKPVFSNTPL